MKNIFTFSKNLYSVLAFLSIWMLTIGETKAQLSGTKNIGGPTPDYPTIAAAITALNTQGVGSGGVRFMLPAGYTETAANLAITATGTSNDSIFFQKLGAGANPRITAAAGTSTLDGIIKLIGTDYITFNGIDLLDPSGNSTATTRMEWGYALLKNNATDGCQHVTIKNCNVTLQKANAPSIGIYAANHIATATTALTIAAFSGTNSYITLDSNTITNTYNGISFVGSTTQTFYDQSNKIGIVGGNSISNFGGGTTAANGISVTGQNNILISKNTISGGTSTTGALTGILTSGGTESNIDIIGNTITNLGGGTTAVVTGISNSIGANGTINTININYNVVKNCTYTTATTADFDGIINKATATAGTVNMLYDSVYNISLAGTGSLAGIDNEGASSAIYKPCRMAHNIVFGLSKTNTGAGSIWGLRSGICALSVDSNHVYNLTHSGTGNSWGILYSGNSSSVDQAYESFVGNRVYNITCAGTTGVTRGISTGSSVGQRFIAYNTIYAISANSGVIGIDAGINSVKLHHNKIYNLSTNGNVGTNGASSTVEGILLAGVSESPEVYNNLIGDLKAPTSANVNAVRGIHITEGTASTSLKLCYNTVYLSAASTAANFGSSALFFEANNLNLISQNNIFINKSKWKGTGLTVAFRVSNPSLTNYHATSNANLLYADSVSTNNLIFYDGTSGDHLISHYFLRVGNRDSISFRENTTFLNLIGDSVNFLHINPAVATQVESGGLEIPGYTDDFDSTGSRSVYPIIGQINNAGFKPDIGADEGDFIRATPPVLNMIYDSSSVNQITGNAYINNTQRILKIKIATSDYMNPLEVTSFNLNTTGTTNINTISQAKIYYTKGFDAFDTTSLFGSTIPTPGTYSISGSQNLIEGNNYFWLVYDVNFLATGGNILDGECTGMMIGSISRTPATPAPVGNRAIVAPLSGTYTVGTGGNYTTLTAALADASLKGISATTTFSLTSATYGPAETFPIVLDEPAVALGARIIIKPAPGVNATITGLNTTTSTSNSCVLKLNGADYVTIDGSNTPGGTTRNLTLVNTNVGLESTVIQLASKGQYRGCISDTIKNCNIKTGLSSGMTTTEANRRFFGLVATEGVSPQSGQGGADHRDLVVINNQFTSGSVLFRGTAGSKIQNIVFKNNIVGPDISVGFLELRNVNNAVVTENVMNGIVRGSGSYNAVYINEGVTNLEFSRNSISNVINANESRAAGITIHTGVASNSIFKNNIIYGIFNNGSSGLPNWGGFGINIQSGSGYKIYNNSVYMWGNRDTISTNKPNVSSVAMHIGSAVSSPVDIVNNIFSNTQTAATNNRKSYAIYSFAASDSVFGALDYNIYHVEGAQGAVAGTSTDTFFTLTPWRALMNTKDANSQFVSPGFLSTSDLHLSAGCNRGITLPDVVNDYEGTTRISPPVIGAYEFSPVNNNIGTRALLAPVSNYALGAQDIRILVQNLGANPVTSFDAFCKINNDAPIVQPWSGTLNPCDTISIVFTGVNLSSISKMLLYTAAPNNVTDADKSNDTLKVILYSNLGGVYTIGGINPDFVSFNEAVNALKQGGVGDTVTFNVPAGTSFTEMPLVLQGITGSQTYPITFRKNGAGTNPAINAGIGVGTVDAMVTLKGISNITFDGIDLKESAGNAGDNAKLMEYGYLIVNASSNLGSTNNSIKNSAITLNRANTATIGILQSANTLGGGIAPSGLTGANHLNRYQNISVSNSYNGILITGSGAFPDSNNTITLSTIGSNTANDIGNGGTTAYGIQLDNQNNPEVSNCMVRNVTTTTTLIHGIYLNNTTGNLGKATIKNNIVYNVKRTSTSTAVAGGVYGIRVDVSPTAYANVFNNVVHSLESGNTSSANANIFIRGIAHCASGTGSAGYYNNTVSVSSVGTLNISSAAFWKAGGAQTVIKNNAFMNTSPAQTGVAKHYAIYFATPLFLSSTHNLFWSTNANGYIGFNTGDLLTLNDWRNGSGVGIDAHSSAYLPNLTINNQLQPNPADTAAWALNGRGIHTDSTIFSTDINDNARPTRLAIGIPDIGAYEFSPDSGVVAPLAKIVGTIGTGLTQALLSPFNNDTVAKIKWNGTTLPSEIKVRQYVGEVPPKIGTADYYMYYYTHITATGTGPYDFDMNLFYNEEWLGTIPNETDLRIIKHTAPGNDWVLPLQTINSVVNVSQNIISDNMLTHFGLFTGTDMIMPLPVKLVSFDASVLNKDVLLTWATASELNANRFIVEYSIDNKNWSETGNVKAAGNTTFKSSYQLTDINAFAKGNTLFYRLKMVDNDGSYAYSNTVSVSLKTSLAGKTIVYPNPFTENITIEINSENEGKVNYQLINITGKEIGVPTGKQLIKGKNELQMNTDDLDPGIYFLSIDTNGITQTIKVIKQ